MDQNPLLPGKLFADAAQNFQALMTRNFTDAGEAMPSAFQTMARLNIEALRLAARHAEACSELRDKLAQCRSGPEFFKIQTDFFETMRQNYTEEWFRMFELARGMTEKALWPNGSGRVEVTHNKAES